jgi:DNA invertase Pin-like site-specific DNA recombinase
MKQRLQALGWLEVEIIDEDLGRSATSTLERTGFQRMVADVCLGRIGAIAAREVSRFARNNNDWHQLIEMCSLVDTLLIDQETVYDPRRANDRLLLGLKGSMSEYELDLLRQRSLEARWAKARRGELVISAPVGFIKTPNQRLELDPNAQVQAAIRLIFDKFLGICLAGRSMCSISHSNCESVRLALSMGACLGQKAGRDATFGFRAHRRSRTSVGRGFEGNRLIA